MAKEELIEAQGKVIECLPNASFRIILENTNSEIIASISGRMRKNNIRVLLGDLVSVEISLYDMTRGRITYRYK